MLFTKIAGVMAYLQEAAQKYKIDTQYLSIALKIIGIAYVCEFGVQVCKDAGENSIASKVELGGKVLIAVMAVPSLRRL
jgi:stage III sporulation protein AD